MRFVGVVVCSWCLLCVVVCVLLFVGLAVCCVFVALLFNVVV